MDCLPLSCVLCARSGRVFESVDSRSCDHDIAEEEFYWTADLEDRVRLNGLLRGERVAGVSFAPGWAPHGRHCYVAESLIVTLTNCRRILLTGEEQASLILLEPDSRADVPTQRDFPLEVVLCGERLPPAQHDEVGGIVSLRRLLGVTIDHLDFSWGPQLFTSAGLLSMPLAIAGGVGALRVLWLFQI